MACAFVPLHARLRGSLPGETHEEVLFQASSQKPQHSQTEPKPRMSWWVWPTSLAAQLGRVPCAATLDGEEGRFPSQ